MNTTKNIINKKDNEVSTKNKERKEEKIKRYKKQKKDTQKREEKTKLRKTKKMDSPLLHNPVSQRVIKPRGD